MTARQTTHRRDRWADWAVILLVVVALVGGLILREAVLSRSVPFDFDTADISGSRPADWIEETGDDPLLRVTDPLGGTFDPTLELRSRPLAAEAEPTLILNDLSRERATQVDAYQTLSTDQVTVDGTVATRRTFTYVEVDRNPYMAHMPAVVKGIDLAIRDDDRVVIVTYLAEVDDFDTDYRYFHALVESLEF